MPKPKRMTKLCYVIMPFSKTKACTEEEWTDIFDAVIKPAVEGAGLGYSCRRSEATTGNVINKIVDALYRADVVIADLTDRNPNVFYELGVRHTLKNRTMMIAQRRNDIPSDLHGYASHVYKWKTSGDKAALTRKLRALLRHIEDDTDRSDNPVSDFLDDRSIKVFQFQRQEVSRKLRAVVAELKFVKDVLKQELNAAGSTDDGHVYVCPHACPAMDHLIATQYVTSPTLNGQIRALRSSLEMMGGLRVLERSLAETLHRVDIVTENAESVSKAHDAGDPLETVAMKTFDSWSVEVKG